MTGQGSDGTSDDPHPDSWAAHLREGEELLWSGRPNLKFRIKFPSFQVALKLTGLFAMLGLVTVLGAAQSTSPWAKHANTIWLTIALLPLFALTLGMSWYNTRSRRKTHYSLTNLRAIIAKDSPFKGLVSIPIHVATTVRRINTRPPSVHFVAAPHIFNTAQANRGFGFDLIKDADHVLDLVNQIIQSDRENQEPSE